MKTVIVGLCILSVNGLSLASETTPKDPEVKEFQALLKRAFFLEIKKPKPVLQAQAPAKNNTLVLRGVARFEEGWLVTLVDRTKPKVTFFLEEGKPKNAQGIRLIKVNQNKQDYTKTTAVLNDNGTQITIGYDQKSIQKGLTKTKQLTSVRQPLTTPQQEPATGSSTSVANPQRSNKRLKRKRSTRGQQP